MNTSVAQPVAGDRRNSPTGHLGVWQRRSSAAYPIARITSGLIRLSSATVSNWALRQFIAE